VARPTRQHRLSSATTPRSVWAVGVDSPYVVDSAHQAKAASSKSAPYAPTALAAELVETAHAGRSAASNAPRRLPAGAGCKATWLASCRCRSPARLSWATRAVRSAGPAGAQSARCRRARDALAPWRSTGDIGQSSPPSRHSRGSTGPWRGLGSRRRGSAAPLGRHSLGAVAPASGLATSFQGFGEEDDTGAFVPTERAGMLAPVRDEAGAVTVTTFQ